jgi:hypothetical protein
VYESEAEEKQSLGTLEARTGHGFARSFENLNLMNDCLAHRALVPVLVALPVHPVYTVQP